MSVIRISVWRSYWVHVNFRWCGRMYVGWQMSAIAYLTINMLQRTAILFVGFCFGHFFNFSICFFFHFESIRMVCVCVRVYVRILFNSKGRVFCVWIYANSVPTRKSFKILCMSFDMLVLIASKMMLRFSSRVGFLCFSFSFVEIDIQK